MVVSNIFFIFPYIGDKIPSWLSYFQRGSNHQPDEIDHLSLAGHPGGEGAREKRGANTDGFRIFLWICSCNIGMDLDTECVYIYMWYIYIYIYICIHTCEVIEIHMNIYARLVLYEDATRYTWAVSTTPVGWWWFGFVPPFVYRYVS